MASKTAYELQVKIGARTSKSWDSSLSKVQRDLKDLNTFSNKVMAAVAAGAAASAASAAYIISNASDTYRDFEQEMATVESISGATGKQFQDMQDAALEAGRDTVFTAQESASALEYMSLAGWDAQESIEGLPSILKLAAATQKDLQVTSDLVTDSMSALKLEIDDLDPYLDKLTKSNNKANTSAEQLMEALVKSGGASRVLNASLDDTITAIDVLANNGKKGEEAGTALNAFYVNLAGNASTIKELNRLKIDIWDDNGEFVGLEEALTRIKDGLAGLTDEERALSLKKIAGKHYYSQVQYLLDAVEEVVGEDGKVTTAWESLKKELENSSGSLNQMYETATDTLRNAQLRLQSAKDDMQIRIVDVFSDDSKEFITWLADEIPNVTDAIVDFAEAHEGEFAAALEDVGDGIEVLWTNGIEAGKWITKNRKAITGALTGVASGIVAVKAASAGMNLVKSLSNPLTLVATGAWTAVTAIGAISGAIEDAEREAINANLDKHFGDIALSLEDINSVADHIVSSDNLTGVMNAIEQFKDLGSITDTMDEAVEEIEKLNWKVSIGMELTPDEQDTYKKAIDDYVQAANDYALQAQYAVSINMALSFDESDLEESNIVDKVNKFYADKYTELADLGTKLKDTVTNAFTDGLLDIDETKEIAELQAQMAELEKSLAVGEFEGELSALQLEYSAGNMDADSFKELQDKILEKEENAKETYRTAYIKDYNSILASHDGGYLSDEEYQKAIEALQQQYETNVANLEAEALNFQLSTIMDQYADELDPAISEYTGIVQGILDDYSDWDQSDQELIGASIVNDLYKQVEFMSGLENISEESRRAITELLEQIEPMAQDLMEKKQTLSGDDVSEAMYKAAEAYSMLEAVSYGNYISEGAAYVAGQVVQDSGEWENVRKAIEDEGYYTGYSWIDNLKQGASDALQDGFDVKVNQSTTYSSLQGGGLNEIRTVNRGREIMHNYDGGIYYSPILTTFAEHGAEAAIPLDGSQNAKSLWLEAGSILGMLNGGSRDQKIVNNLGDTNSTLGSIQIMYNPTVTVQGNATKEDIDNAMSLSLNELKELIKEINHEEKRTNF